MAKAVNPFKTRPYILEEDRAAFRENPDFKPTVFRLGALTHKQHQHIRDNAIDVGQFSDGADGIRAGVKQGTIQVETVRYGVRGWENLTDDDGTVIEAKFRDEKQGGGLTNDCMDRIVPFIAELCEAITSDNSVSLDDLKN